LNSHITTWPNDVVADDGDDVAVADEDDDVADDEDDDVAAGKYSPFFVGRPI